MLHVFNIVCGLAGLAIIYKVPRHWDKRVSVPAVIAGWALVLISVLT